MYNVLDICRYVINYSNDHNYEISNLKLQKLLYYIQASFLANTGEPCFKEKILNKTYGAVIDEAYREYRIYSYKNIPKQNEYKEIIYDKVSEKIKYETYKVKFDNISDKHKKLIEEIVNSYKDYNIFKLVNKNLVEEPCKNSKQNDIISENSIKEYYFNNKEKLYG